MNVPIIFILLLTFEALIIKIIVFVLICNEIIEYIQLF